MAQSAKRAGFGGIDLTVRTGGHVMPQRAAEDLPKAVAAIRAEGLEVPMITTELLSGDDPTAAPILSTAGEALHSVYRSRGTTTISSSMFAKNLKRQAINSADW